MEVSKQLASADKERIVLIGAGNVATHLGIALQQAGWEIAQVYSRTEASASELDELERYYIDKYKPTLNRQLVAGSNGFEPITTKISPKNLYSCEV